MTEPGISRADGSDDEDLIVDAGDDWTLRIAPCDLSFLRFDYQTRLQFGATEVVIECPFVIRIGGIEHHLDPEEHGRLGSVAALYPDTLSSAWVDAQATLRLSLASGATITVPSDVQYEAWQVSGPGTFLVVWIPGTSGELAIWK